MKISLRLLWDLVVNWARRLLRLPLGLVWKISESLTRSTANRGSVQVETGQPPSLVSSVEETLPDPTIHATTPVAFSALRYAKSIPDYSTSKMLIVAGPPSKVDLAPEGWKQLSNPEGQPYFYHEQHHIVTENNMMETDIRKEVEEKHGYLARHAQSLGSINSASIEFFINLQDDDGPKYYLIDHQVRTVSWLTDVDSEVLDLDPAYSENHMALQRESLYWSHVEIFPMHLDYPEDSEDYLFSVLNQALLDGITCLTSTAAYSPDECKRFIGILKSYRKKDGYRLWSLARLWTFILKNRFIHLHGQQPARLHRLARLTEDITPPLPLVSKLILGTLFFNSYQGHIDSLEDIYVDGIAYTQHWRSFLEERLREWNAVTLVATVLWTVGVGLLQVMLGSTDSTSAVIRDLIVGSTFCAMTSTVLSLLHERQHRRRAKEDDSSNAADYLHRHYDPERGFLYLAMLYCLPYVLLLWGFLLAAVATFIFGIKSGRIVVPILAVIMCAAILITVLTWNVEGSISDARFWQWKTKYLLLMKEAATRWYQSFNSRPLPLEEITAGAPRRTSPGDFSDRA